MISKFCDQYGFGFLVFGFWFLVPKEQCSIQYFCIEVEMSDEQ